MPNVGKEAFTAKILCPFYKDHCRKGSLIYVKCEGLLKGSLIRLCFRRERSLIIFMARRCCGDWKNCPYALAAGEKYEDRQNG